MSELTPIIALAKKERKARPIEHHIRECLRARGIDPSELMSNEAWDEFGDLGVIGGAPSQRDENGFTPGQKKKADAYEKFHERRRVKGEDEDEAIKIVAKEMKIKTEILRKVIKHGREDVNLVLRHRGLIRS